MELKIKKVFWDNPYQSSLITTVNNITDNCVLLHETIIFSFSGGQESDEATINGFKVLNSEIKGNLI
jgi:Ser-tRNA(Ala) deacylase AlaX